MAASLLILTLGGVMVYSALTGTSILDVLAGKQNEKLDPSGGSRDTDTNLDLPSDALTGGITGGAVGQLTGKGSYKGPNAALLNRLEQIAVRDFNLTITSRSGGNHVSGSYHGQGRAFDASGKEADMRAFSRFVFTTYGSQIKELIHNPGPAIKDNKPVTGAQVFSGVWLGHRDHVHVAA